MSATSPASAVVRRTVLVLLSAIAVFGFPASRSVEAQSAEYRLTLGPGAELVVDRDSVLTLLEATRALQRELEEDPAVLYYTGAGPAVAPEHPEKAFPWNAVEVLTDSTASIRTPGNLREARRAYHAYAVVRMANVRSDPEVSCDSTVAREASAVASFVDGWIVARALFGSPPYAPLDELALARSAGHGAAMLAALGSPALGECLERWAAANEGSVRAYRAWRLEALGAAASPDAPEEAGKRSSFSPF